MNSPSASPRPKGDMTYEHPSSRPGCGFMHPCPPSRSQGVVGASVAGAQRAADISSGGWAVSDVADAGILRAFCCVVDTLSVACLRPGVSQLCGCCVPGCQHLL